MRLRAAILAADPAPWGALLAQVGFPAVTPGDPYPHDATLLVVADDASGAMIDAARDRLRTNGAVLCSGRVHAAITGSPATERAIGYLVQDEPGGVFTDAGLVDCFRPCSIPAGANMLRAGDRRPSAYAGPCGGGWIVALPFDAAALRADVRAIEKSFWLDRPRLPYERVSRVSRGGVRRIVARAIEFLHHRRGLPYAHLHHAPGEAASLFAFRIDTDFSGEGDVRALAALLERHGIPATWFVHVEGQERLLPFYRSLAGHEIGLHCYAHRAFASTDDIVADARRALAVMGDAGLRPTSYAAPYGRWSPALAAALAELGVDYSSEFSYAYDDLPSYPAPGGPLQVPVHPISVGNLRRQGCTEREMGEYFVGAAATALASGEPLFFYHHPKNGHHGALERLFGYARERGVGPTLLGAYAHWSKERLAAAPSAALHEDVLELAGPAIDIRWRVTRDSASAAFAPATGRVALESLPWRPRAAVPPLPARIGRLRAFNPWIPLHKIENTLHRLTT